MCNLSQSSKNMIRVHEQGFRINENGSLINKRGHYVEAEVIGGYFRKKLTVGGSQYSLPLHRLQAYQKFGDEMFGDGIVVRHINGISWDNSFENIEIGTHMQNMQDKTREDQLKGLSAANKVSRANKQDAPHDTMMLIGGARASGMSVEQVYCTYRISKKHIYNLYHKYKKFVKENATQR